jgi:glycosyltransferase involved in cell wall biosynthesis
VISISRSVEKHVVEKLKLPPQRSYLLYNAISRKENNSMKNNSRKKELLYVGRLEKQKSVETLLRSLTKIENRNVNLTIVGDGSLKNKLQNEAVRLGVHNMVTFTGAQKNVQSFYNTADVFVLPSIWEGFGIVILEAFRSGIPVIASNLEGPSELIEHNANGLLFEPKNSDQLASLIKKLIDNDEERKRLGENGYQTFLKNYDINTYVQKLYEIYLDD